MIPYGAIKSPPTTPLFQPLYPPPPCSRMPAHAHPTQPLSATLNPRPPPPPPDPITRPKARPRSAFSKGQPCHPPARYPVAARHSTYNPQPVKGRGGHSHSTWSRSTSITSPVIWWGTASAGAAAPATRKQDRSIHRPDTSTGGSNTLPDLAARTYPAGGGGGGWLATLCFWEGVAARCVYGERAARTAFNTCTSLVLSG